MARIKNLSSILVVFLCVSFSPQGWCSGNEELWQLDEGFTELSDAEEIEMGKRVDKYIRDHFYLETDPGLNEAVNEITQKLASVSDRKTLPYTCTILRSHSINAFSAPGGHIYVTYGLLSFARTEDEVAGIIGHEVAHAALRHAAKLYHELKNAFSGKDENAGNTMDLLLLYTHLEEFEQVADTTGVLYAQKAGYNPAGLADFLERHLAFIIRHRIFSVLGFSSNRKITARIKHLREYVLKLEDEKIKK